METPGVVPGAQQLNLPRIQFCDAASDESKQAAEGLRFQAARIFALDVGESPRNHQVSVQEFLMADDEAMIAETYAALADGIAACEAGRRTTATASSAAARSRRPRRSGPSRSASTT